MPVSPVHLECNPEIPVAPGEEHWLLDTSLDEVYLPCSHSRAIPSFPSQLEPMIALPWANTRGILNSPSNSRIPPQLEKNHVVPPSSQDEALSRYSVSGQVPREELEVETELGTLDAPPQISPASRSPWRGTPRFSGTTSSEPLLPS